MKQQLKGNKMPDYKTKGGGKISTKKSISKAGQKILGMKNIKKPVQKKGLGGVLAAGAIPGLVKKGDLQKFAMSGLGGIIPMAIARQQKKSKAKKARMASANMPQVSGGPSAGVGMTEMTRRMAMGGQIKRTKSIDGIAMKGKTRAI
tara:strand:+ start:205 stop:645 length:441 start_codon:yes stop_codon:yes gene_type:complete